MEVVIMTIEVTSILRRTIKLETDCRIKGRKCGDLIKEWQHGHENNRPAKAVVVGIDYECGGRVWTVNENSKDFSASYWSKPHVLGHTKLIKRPHSPDLTIEGLKKSLKEFIDED